MTSRAAADVPSAGTGSTPDQAWPWPSWARSPAPAAPVVPAATVPIETSPAADKAPMPPPRRAAPGPAPLSLATAGATLRATPATAPAVTEASPFVVDTQPNPPIRRAAGQRIGLGVVPILAGVLLLLLALILGLKLAQRPAGQDVLGAIGRPGSGVGLVGAPSTVAPNDELVMPALTRSALTQAILLDERLAAASAALQGAIAAARFDAVEVARILRLISADSVYGSSLASIVIGWRRPRRSDRTFMRSTRRFTRAADALVPSVQLESDYRQAVRPWSPCSRRRARRRRCPGVLARVHRGPSDGSPDAGAAGSPGPLVAPQVRPRRRAATELTGHASL